MSTNSEKFVLNPEVPQRIRQKYVEQAQEYRSKFINVLADIFNRFGVVDLDPGNYFQANFYHKLRKSYKPDFQALFGNNYS